MNLRHLNFLCTIFVILRQATSQFANGETASAKSQGPGLDNENSNVEEQGFLIVYSVSQRFLNAMDNFFEKWNKSDEGRNKKVVREQGKSSDTNIFTRTRGDLPRSNRQEPRQGDPAVGSKTKAFRGSSRFENKPTTNLRATTTKKKAMIMSSSSTSTSSSSSSMGMSSSISSSVSMMGSSNMMGGTASVAQPIAGPVGAQPANMSEKGDINKNVTAPIVQPVFHSVNFPTPFPTGIPPTPYPTGVRSFVQPQVVAPFDAPVFQQIHQPSFMPQHAKITLSPSVPPIAFPTSIASSENLSRPPTKFVQPPWSVSPSDTPSVTHMMATYPSLRFPTMNPSESPSSLSSSQTSSLSPIFKFPTVNPSGAPSPSAQISLEPTFRFPTIIPSGAPSPTSSQRTTGVPVPHLTSIRLLDFRVIADAVSSAEDLRSETRDYLTVAFRAAVPGFVQLELVERNPFRGAHRALQTQMVLYFGGTAFYGFGSVVKTANADDPQVASLSNITSFQLYLNEKLGSSAPKLFVVIFEPTPFPTQSPIPLPTTAIQTIVPELPSIPPGNATEGPRTDRPTTNAPSASSLPTSAAPTSRTPATEAPTPAPGNPTEAPTVADAFLLLLPKSSPPTTVAPTPNPSTNDAAPSSFPSNLPSTSPSSTTVSPFRPSNAPSATFMPSIVPSNLPTTSTVDRSSAPSIS